MKTSRYHIAPNNDVSMHKVLESLLKISTRTQHYFLSPEHNGSLNPTMELQMHTIHLRTGIGSGHSTACFRLIKAHPELQFIMIYPTMSRITAMQDLIFHNECPPKNVQFASAQQIVNGHFRGCPANCIIVDDASEFAHETIEHINEFAKITMERHPLWYYFIIG